MTEHSRDLNDGWCHNHRAFCSYSPVPGDPFRVLTPHRISREHAEYRRMFPNGVPLRDADLTDEQRAFLASGRRFS